jgi:uncharacterized protein
MTLEWPRRRDPALEDNLRRFFFTTAPITELGPAGSSADHGPAGAITTGVLGIGSLKGALL